MLRRKGRAVHDWPLVRYLTDVASALGNRDATLLVLRCAQPVVVIQLKSRTMKPQAVINHQMG